MWSLALWIPPGDKRDIVLAMTCVVVVFSILVQGLPIGPLFKRFAQREMTDKGGVEAASGWRHYTGAKRAISQPLHTWALR